MKTILLYASIVLAALITTLSCTKNQVGGSGKVSGIVAHHGKAISDAHVYIKYDTNEFPGDDYSLYDTYVKADGAGNYNIPFYKGTYYIYARGYDYAIPHPYIVKGGLSVTVRNKENLTRELAVTEQ